MKSTKTVLVVDDQPMVLELLDLALQTMSQPPQVIRAQSTKEALAILDTQAIDLITTDIKRPTGNGLEFLQKLQERKNSPPAFVITASDDPAIRQVALMLGAKAYFYKPFIVKEFVNAVSTQLEAKCPA